MSTKSFSARGQPRLLSGAALLAASLPSLLAYNASPSPTFLNQALAFALWAGFVFACMPTTPWRDTALRGPLPLQAALAALLAAAVWSMTAGGLPASLGWSSVCTLLATMVLVAGGAAARARDLEASASAQGHSEQGEHGTQGKNGKHGKSGKHAKTDQLFAAFCWAWLISGGLNLAIALIQVFWPDLPDADGHWIAHSGFPGRAVGNLRQPNHLSSLLLWSCIAVIGLLELQRLRRSVAAVLLAALVFAVVLTASRTGLVSVVLLALWGLADRRLSKQARALLIAAPLMYALSWLLMAQWAAMSQHSFGGSQRLAESDISSSRFAIWRDTLTLIAQQPWAGVGFGEFNFAWTLTPLPQRPVAFFDHTHNLLLQLAVELGLPLALLTMGLLLWGLWRGCRNAWAPGPAAAGDAGGSLHLGHHIDGNRNIAQRCAMLVVLMIGLHSLLEYPLWYSYFLLPAAWAWGYALMPAAGPRTVPRRPSWALVVSAAVVVAGTALAVVDYMRVAVIFSADDSLPPLQQRIASGQRSVFFAHHADYAAVTSGSAVADPAHAFGRATHFLLDTRLMTAWAKSLASQGQLDAARHLAARLREFRKADTDEFFDACPDAPTPGMAVTLVNEPAGATFSALSASASASASASTSTSAPASASASRGAFPSTAIPATASAAASPAAPPAASPAASPAALAASGAVSPAVAFQCELPVNDPDWRFFLTH